MNEPTVSVVLTAHNRYPYLVRTIRSLLGQNYPALEVLVVDDASTDDTPKLKYEYAPAVRYFRLDREHEGWRNHARPMNVGIKRALGEYLIMQTGDVFHEPDTIVRLLSRAVVDPVLWLFPRVIGVAADGKLGTTYVSEAKPRPLGMCSILRTKYLLAIRGLDEDYTAYGDDDTDLALRLKRGMNLKLAFTDEITVYHQEHPRDTRGHEEMRKLYRRKCAEWDAGKSGAVRNLNREWGQL